MKGKRVLLIGWDAADWKVIDDLMARGLMPTLKKFVEGGVRGNLSTLEPVYSPMLWSSIATGKFADKHGIWGFTEPDYEMGIVRPISSRSRKARAIWNILSQQGYKTNVFSWWPSHPAEPINGICVSNLYQRANQSIDKPWPMASGQVHPESLTDQFAELRIHPDELTEAHILPFIPLAAKVDQSKDRRIGSLSRILADAATVHAASTWAMENSEWDFTAIYHDAVDHACHGYMKFRPPMLPGMPKEMFEIYKDVVDGMYRFHDMMLERTLQLAGPDTNVILMSDHGFQSDHLRPLQLPKEPGGPAAEHRKHGIIVCNGPDFKQGQSIYGSSIIDITPTILTLFDLPVGQDMDGTPLLQVFQEPKTVKNIPSWEDVEGNFHEHPENVKVNPEEAKAAVKQLVELGYIDDPGDNMKAAMAKTDRELQYNLARVYISKGQTKEGLDILEKINASHEESRFLMRIADARKRMGDFKGTLEAIERITELSESKQHSPTSLLMMAEIKIQEGETQEALRMLVDLGKQIPHNPSIIKYQGECYGKLKQWNMMERAYRDSLRIDPHDASAFKGLALALLRQKKYEEAVEAALTATELIYQFPTAHHILGEALYGLGEHVMAARSLEVAVTMRPALNAPRLLLEKIYKKHNLNKEEIFKNVKVESVDASGLNRMEDLQEKVVNAKSYKGVNRGEIVVVSGLPRSGTSLMMQMLDAGGIEIFTDKVRQPDENNPKGFYEHEKVKGLARQSRWMKDARGKGVKVISQLVKFLPANFSYKIIIMQRDIQEVVLSQHKMLVRDGKAKEDTYPIKMERNFQKAYTNARAYAQKQPFIEFIEMKYTDVLSDPTGSAKQVAEFLGRDMDLEAMALRVDPTLYRNRSKKED